MSLRQWFKLPAITPFLAAFILAVIALGWGRGTESVSATPSSGSAVQGASCPLTPVQELNSIKSFQKMMPVFRHPRCSNCHGGIPRPLPKNGAPSIRHAGVVDMDSTDDNRTCEECHVEDWGQPGAPDWSDRTDLDLCRSMHLQFRQDAARFIDHILRDGGDPPGFIKLAFEGKRGLLEGGLTIYEAELGQKLRAEPPPGTHAQLLQQARDWVAAQGGSFVGDPDCGCVVDKMEVHFKTKLVVVDHGPANETGTIAGEGSVILKLAPDLSEPEWEVTTGPPGARSMITWSFVDVTRSNGCIVAILSNPPTEVDFWLGMSVKPELKFGLQIVPAPDIHGSRWRCPKPPPLSGMIPGPIGETDGIFSAAWASIHGGPGAGPMQGLAPLAPGAAPAPSAAALDMKQLMALDPKKLAAMAEQMKNNQTPAGMADLGKLMNQVLPNANQMVEAARTNFRFAIPDAKWCKLETGTAFLAQCVISQKLTVPNNKGSTQTITETTTITIGRPKP